MRKITLTLFLLVIAIGVKAQITGQSYKGWPGHDDISNLKECFINPPKGYGNVPFYWWNGDSLKIERLNEQLKILSSASTDGLCVSYHHTHYKVDSILNAAGHGYCGRVSGGVPRIMTREWQKIWNDFSALCGEEKIGLGMDDYVIAWPGNGEFIDSVLAMPSIKNYQGLLVKVTIPKSSSKPENALTKIGEDKDSSTYICTTEAPWLHPEFGNEVVDHYLNPFIYHMDTNGIKGMNYFFQDELQYDLRLQSWCEDMPEQFLKIKGYDIVPHLGSLFITDSTLLSSDDIKYRLDYAEVLTILAEERYFKPMFDWSNSRGLIYGCDPEGRGLRPLQYLDYFRAISWFNAPGNDAPSRGSSFRQTKVSSSVSHMYNRPRTWLEAFHSMGWDANGALLKKQLDHHIIAGGNLLCMHGLYYSTHGGFWEWAPPCFHFRMPYWEHMKLWLKYAERMCFLLSQGTHICDIAVLYPTETMQAIPGTDAESTFRVSMDLSEHGLDYDFIDYQSLQNAKINNRKMIIGNESYKILVLVDTKALHSESLQKIKEFRRKGGIVISIGNVMSELRNANIAESEIVGKIHSLIEPDFKTVTGTGKVLHRNINGYNVYMVMDVENGDEMFFRSKGQPEKWDAMKGTFVPLSISRSDKNGCWIKFDEEKGNSELIVFSPAENPVYQIKNNDDNNNLKIASTKHIDGKWDIQIIPTLNNKWGDFRLPASNEYIGIEAREFTYGNNQSNIYGYGPHMLTYNLDSAKDLKSFIMNQENVEWLPYCWSWQYGVLDSPGGQGWHGLKAKIDSRFLILDKGCHQIFKTQVYVPHTGKYVTISEGTAPSYLFIDNHVQTTDSIVKLSKGWHQILIAYENTKHTEYDLSKCRGEFLDKRERGMVMIYPEKAFKGKERGMYDNIVASKWYGTDFLKYDIYGADKNREYTYCFKNAPGTIEMKFHVNGTIKKVLIDGKNQLFSINENGECTIDVTDNYNTDISNVSITGIPQIGYMGGAFFETPVYIKTDGGQITEGDWTQFGALGFYSGGIKYTKEIDITRDSKKIILDLGDIDATCEVRINDNKSEILIGSPYQLDITKYLDSSINKIKVEITVYSSLSNHYRTIPSPYRGTPRAGLIGPVKLINYN